MTSPILAPGTGYARSPVILSVPTGPILAEVTEAIGLDPVLSIRFGDVLVLVLPAELAEDLIDSTLDALADRSAPVTVPRGR